MTYYHDNIQKGNDKKTIDISKRIHEKAGLFDFVIWHPSPSLEVVVTERTASHTCTM